METIGNKNETLWFEEGNLKKIPLVHILLFAKVCTLKNYAIYYIDKLNSKNSSCQMFYVCFRY